MNKFEYHLLYVLSEPPISVAQRRRHGWKVGDVLSTPKNPAFHPSDRFIVLDVNERGRAMALKISEVSTQAVRLGEYIDVGPKGLNISESELSPGMSQNN